MLHDGHHLHSIITLAHDTRQHVVGEIIVASDFAVLCGNSNVRFVNLQRSWFHWALVLELVFLKRGMKFKKTIKNKK